MTDEEIAVRLEAHEHEIKSLKHRMDDQEEQTKTLNDLVISVKELALNMKNMIDEQQRQGNRLYKLENEPADSWKGAKKTAAAAVISTVAGALAVGLIMLLAQYI